MPNTGPPLYLEYLEDNEGAPEIPWRMAMDAINNAFLVGMTAALVRADVVVITTNLASMATDATKRAAIGKGGIIYSITTDKPSWVRAYTSQDALNDDAGRPVTTDPISGHGVLAEVVTAEGLLSIPMSPPASYWNGESPPVGTIPLSITNHGESGVVTVTIKYLKLEN